MATNIYAREFTEKIIRKVTESGKDGTILRPLLEVRPEYLQAALDRIDEKYSGLGAYVKTILNADVDLLREKYLE
jgi:protein-tyrosine phosphatase